MPNDAGPTVFENAVATMHAARKGSAKCFSWHKYTILRGFWSGATSFFCKKKSSGALDFAHIL